MFMKCKVCPQRIAVDPLAVESVRDAHGDLELGDEGEAGVVLAVEEGEVGLVLCCVMRESADVDVIAHRLIVLRVLRQIQMLLWMLRDHQGLLADVPRRKIDGLEELPGRHVPDGEALK